MLTPNEVRYGNWILVPTEKGKFEWDQVIEISEHRVVTKFYSQNNSMGFAWKDVKGIELTLDILEKAGFEKQDKLNVGAQTYFKKGMGEYLSYHYDGLIVYEANGTSIKYFHQLENLYHSLTGNELEFKQSKPLA